MMDPTVKKKVLKAFGKSGDEISASSVTWVTQSSFSPPLVAVGLRIDSGPYHIIRDSGIFALHIVPEEEKELASSFFRHAQVVEDRINGHAFTIHPEYNVPILEEPPAYLIGQVRTVPEIGDHHLVIAEVVDAEFREQFAPMTLKDAGWSYSG